jgi:flagellar motility protein MotE (MotC chaperone)
MRKPAEIALPATATAEPENTTVPPEKDLTAATTQLPQADPTDTVVTDVLGPGAHQPESTGSPGDGVSAKGYCDNIANAAADARFAWQKKALLQTEQQVAKRIEELNAKIAEYRKWLARRDEFAIKAQKAVVDIYSKMKPDAAAQQLTVLDEEMAAAVLTKLDPRVASAVMNEMETKRAARLTAIIAGAIAGPSNRPPFTEPMLSEAAAKGRAP